MPRWKALPDELDPQVKEFAQQLRRLMDRSGLSVSAVADRTGYSKTSWERYLGGRLLAPKGAVVALAEVTGTDPVHLTTMWELAERAWSRAESRHDRTMDAIRISRARAALGEFGAAPEIKGGGKAGRGATVTPGVSGPAGVSPTVPPQPTAAQTADAAGDTRAPREGSGPGGSWGLAGFKGPSRAGGRPAASPRSAPDAPTGTPDVQAGTPDAPGAAGPAAAAGPPEDARPDTAGAFDRSRRKRQLTMFVAGLVGALLVIAAAFYLTGGNDKKTEAAPKPSATSASPAPTLPAGVKCSGASCTGEDPETMGCGGTLATSATSVTVGTTLVEVRYSRTCGAAWARITRAAQGDTVEVSAAGAPRQTGSVTAAGDTDAYTPMVAAGDANAAKACVTLTSGQKGCTK